MRQGIQRHLFPFLGEALGPLTDFHRKVAAASEVVRIEDEIADEYLFGGPISRWKVFRAHSWSRRT